MLHAVKINMNSNNIISENYRENVDDFPPGLKKIPWRASGQN